jgi:hypothetical protein
MPLDVGYKTSVCMLYGVCANVLSLYLELENYMYLAGLLTCPFAQPSRKKISGLSFVQKLIGLTAAGLFRIFT